MNKINMLEKVAGNSGVEETGKNYGVTESYSRGGFKNFILAGSAIILGLTYGCGGLRFHPENVNPTEMALRTMAVTGKAGTSRLSNRQRHAAGNAADIISNRSGNIESQENDNTSGYINEDSQGGYIWNSKEFGLSYYTAEGNDIMAKEENGKFYRMKDGKWIPLPENTPIRYTE